MPRYRRRPPPPPCPTGSSKSFSSSFFVSANRLPPAPLPPPPPPPPPTPPRVPTWRLIWPKFSMSSARSGRTPEPFTVPWYRPRLGTFPAYVDGTGRTWWWTGDPGAQPGWTVWFVRQPRGHVHGPQVDATDETVPWTLRPVRQQRRRRRRAAAVAAARPVTVYVYRLVPWPRPRRDYLVEASAPVSL